MSTAALNGGDGVKNNPSAPKQQLTGKVLDGARKQVPSPVDGQNKKQPPPRAWQGPNPITQRASSNAPNGAGKPLLKLQSQPPQSKSSTDLQADKHAHDRSVFLMGQFIGKDATLTLRNGEQFTGVFSGASLESSKTQYVLKMTKRTRLPSHQQVNGTSPPSNEYLGNVADDHAQSFEVQDTVDLCVADVSTAAAMPQQNGSVASSFLTDTQISGRDPSMPRERQLQRWEPGPDSSIDMSLESSGNTEWDQFATNEQMYGVQSTYDENIYTTSIDRSNPEYKRREAEAERIAREIEGSAPVNAHVAEERRRDANRDEAGDEEDKYSGVRRDAALPKRVPGAYVPPSQRPITGAPTVSGAPFDPAIISAHISKPAPAPAAVPAPAPAPTTTSLVSSTTTQEPSVSKESKPVDTPNTASVAVQPAKKKENTTEDRVRDTADAFKQFANIEKLRVRQAQEQKRSNARQEKNVKLNDLKKFAANFKLKSRVPDDLVPILAKDREKQLEIQSRAEEAAKEEELKAKEKSSDKAPSVASPTPSNTAAQPPSAPNEQRAPLNQHPRGRGSQQLRNGPLAPGQPPRNLGQRTQNNQFLNRQGIQPLPPDLRIPTGPPPAPAADGPMSPNAKLNVNAKSFEFRPGASAFTPTGTSPSPHRSLAGPSPTTEARVSFFDKAKSKDKEDKGASSAFDSLKRMAETDYTEADKKKYTPNGGLPQAYHAPPTWWTVKSNDAVSYKAMFPQAPTPMSQGPSPMHTPNPNAGQMPHAHQLPQHMQPMTAPSQRPHFYPQQPQHGHGTHFDPRLQQQFGPNGSVQNSPRAQQTPVAPFNAQIPQMPVQQFPGQPMQNFGMSPSMQFRQPHVQAAPMMMVPGQQPGQMGPMQPGFPQGPQQFRGPQMGGHMMMQQQSSGGYSNGPMPQQGYSPMPQPPQPHLPHMQPQGPAGYSGSPRPPMMQHQGSHQGFQQPGMPMQPHFMPSPGPTHPYHLQHRAMSGGYPQMTPRQQHAVPNHPSPGMPGMSAQGDEGK